MQQQRTTMACNYNKLTYPTKPTELYFNKPENKEDCFGVIVELLSMQTCLQTLCKNRNININEMNQLSISDIKQQQAKLVEEINMKTQIKELYIEYDELLRKLTQSQSQSQQSTKTMSTSTKRKTTSTSTSLNKSKRISTQHSRSSPLQNNIPTARYNHNNDDDISHALLSSSLLNSSLLNSSLQKMSSSSLRNRSARKVADKHLSTLKQRLLQHRQ